MAPSILGVGLPASHSLVPDAIRPNIQKALDDMDDTMKSSPYEWEMLYLTPETPFDQLTSKLREKNWDVVLVGKGVRTMDPLQVFFERIINTVHVELPKAKFAFNSSIEDTLDACKRALA